jgi:hypothetical protein
VRARRALGWTVVALLLAATSFLAEDPPERAADADLDPSTARLARLLGPVRGLAATLQQVRAQSAKLAGEHELALARAELAIDLAPESTDGWRMLATHLGLDLASTQREPDPGRRAELLRAALATLRRGERAARDPAHLALWRGVLLYTHASRASEPEDGARGSPAALPWPGGEAGLWRDAAEAFDRAAELGHPDASALAAACRARATAARD